MKPLTDYHIRLNFDTMAKNIEVLDRTLSRILNGLGNWDNHGIVASLDFISFFELQANAILGLCKIQRKFEALPKTEESFIRLSRDFYELNVVFDELKSNDIFIGIEFEDFKDLQ